MKLSSKKLFIVFLVVLVVSIGVSGSSFAGNNGQQLQIRSKYQISDVSVFGKNQYHHWTTWSLSGVRFHSNSIGSCPFFVRCHKVQTNGWWWVGWVNITVKSGNKSYNCRAFVPENQWWSNVTKVNCP